MATLFKIGKPKNGQRQSDETRFELDNAEKREDGQLADDRSQSMPLGNVQERFPGFFEVPERCVPFEMTPFDEKSSEHGFPAVIHFALDSKLNTMSGSNEDGISAIVTFFDFTNFILDQKQTMGRKWNKSLFALHFDQITQKDEKNGSPEVKFGEGIVDQTIKNLELMPTQKTLKNDDEQHSQSDGTLVNEHVGRYAIEPIHSNLAVKCLRHVVSRQEQQLIKLFDTLAGISDWSHESMSPERIHILEEAKRNIEMIRPLYLEQIKSEESGRVGWHFARRFVDPFSDGAWTLSPVRRVLDAVQQRNSVIATSDDVEIVRLALLWTVLLYLKRPAFFRTSVNVNEFFCRLAEIYLIGPEVFLYDQQIRNCVSILVNDFLIDACQRGQLTLRLNERIASLDQFMPFYEDLLQHFENFSAGDDNFALLLLIGAYLNASRLDGILMAQTLWSPKRNVVRQMILSEEKADPFIPFAFANDRSVGTEGADEDAQKKRLITEAIGKLMTNYTCALEDGTLARGRNGAMCTITIAEMKLFIGQSEADGEKEVPNELVNTMRKTLSKFS